LAGIRNPCGFAVDADSQLLYFNGRDASGNDALMTMDADRNFTTLVLLSGDADTGDYGVIYNGSYYWTSDNYYDSDLYVYDGTNVVQLTGQVGSSIDEDSVEELYLIGNKLFFTASEDSTGDDYIYMADLSVSPFAFSPINSSINADPNYLNPRSLSVINDKLYFFDKPGTSDLYNIYSYDPATSNLETVLAPETAEAGFRGWDRALPFAVGDWIYGVYYDQSASAGALFRSNGAVTERVAMADGFTFECAAPAGTDLVISSSTGEAFFYGDGVTMREVPYSFAGNTSALCDAVTSIQGTYFALPEYPYSSGPWDKEPGYIGLLTPVAVERLGQPVDEEPAKPYTNDPTQLGGGTSTPSTPVTPAANPNLPIVTSPEPGPVNGGGVLEIDGLKFEYITSASIGGKNAKFQVINGVLKIEIPAGLAPGTYDLVLFGSFGRLNVQDYITIAGDVPVTSEPVNKTWTKINQEAETVRMIYKYPVAEGKIQFFENGREIAWVRAVDESDPKLKMVELDGEEVPYLVRTRELKPGKNVFEIYLNGERVWRAAYVLK